MVMIASDVEETSVRALIFDGRSQPGIGRAGVLSSVVFAFALALPVGGSILLPASSWPERPWHYFYQWTWSTYRGIVFHASFNSVAVVAAFPSTSASCL
jgi:hypothetical protein